MHDRHDRSTAFSRGREIVDSMLSQARAGRGGCLLITGHSRHGNSSLLDYCLEQATDFEVTQTKGTERSLPYTALGELLRPTLEHVDSLPPGQARAVHALFTAEPLNPARDLVLSLATTKLLAASAADRPVLWVVDNSDLVDEPSLRTLEFVSRRIVDQPVLLVHTDKSPLTGARTMPRHRMKSVDSATPGEPLSDELASAAPVQLGLAETRAWAELAAGHPAIALTHLRAHSTASTRGETHHTIGHLTAAVESCIRGDLHPALLATFLPLEGPPPRATASDTALWRLGHAVHQLSRGTPVIDIDDDIAVASRSLSPHRLVLAGVLASALGKIRAGRGLHRRAARQARSHAQHDVLPTALDYLATDDLERGHLTNAELHASEGRQRAIQAGQPNIACSHAGSLAVCAALHDRAASARQYASTTLEEAAERGLAGAALTARRALGLLALAAGMPEVAVAELTQACATNNPWALRATVSDLVEAAARIGATDRVKATVERLRAWAELTDAPEGRAAVARCDAIVAGEDTDAAINGFRHALAHYTRSGQVLQLARTQLLLGQTLRDAKRRPEARPYLWAALDTFTRLEMPAWANRAQTDLRACSARGTSRPSPAPGAITAPVSSNDTPESETEQLIAVLATLTAHERWIAAAVGHGATNREVAEQLHISPRTVEYHLTKIFRKLSISSRAQLTRVIATLRIERPLLRP